MNTPYLPVNISLAKNCGSQQSSQTSSTGAGPFQWQWECRFVEKTSKFAVTTKDFSETRQQKSPAIDLRVWPSCISPITVLFSANTCNSVSGATEG